MCKNAVCFTLFCHSTFGVNMKLWVFLVIEDLILSAKIVIVL